jgi:hypothetical protein
VSWRCALIKQPSLAVATKLTKRACKLGVDVTDQSTVEALAKVLAGTHFLVVIKRGGVFAKALVIQGRFKPR